MSARVSVCVSVCVCVSISQRASVRKKQKNKKTNASARRENRPRARGVRSERRARARRHAEKSDLKARMLILILTVHQHWISEQSSRFSAAATNARRTFGERLEFREEETGGSGGFHAPAQTISPVGSTASDTNWQGSGEVMTRKFRYRIRSNARTVPSSDALSNAWPDGKNATAETGALCSANVTKHEPVDADHTFTLWSSAAVAAYSRRARTRRRSRRSSAPAACTRTPRSATPRRRAARGGRTPSAINLRFRQTSTRSPSLAHA